MQLKDLQAYEILEKRPIKDLNSEGIILRHKKSGARIAVISNDDDNKVFYIGFRTPPEDSTGVAHIIEHTVLCGSDKYPVKDPFVELVKGSLNTFLNAMTYPEKTIYPIASCNDKDFQNLMSVYMDAVFHPNIYKYQEIFQQEGWHYELESEDAPVTINGVVYNEMKGAFSSPDDVLSRQIMTSLFPDTTYANVSGGDPLHIPELTYEEYLDFHRRYYHPCNSYIYLYGDMDVAEKLAWMDEAYLGKYEAIGLDSEIKLQKPFEKPIEVTHKYSISSTESEENNTYLSYNMVVGNAADSQMAMAFEVLDYALLSAPGAPLKQALLDVKAGKDVYGSYDDGILQPYFTVIAKGSNPDRKEEFVSVIRQVLGDIVKNGIDRKAVEAGINYFEFRYREADFSSYPKGLMYSLDILGDWLYEKGNPFAQVQQLTVFENLKKAVNEGYFEELIRKYLLENPHGCIMTLIPKKGLAAQREKELEEKLEAYRSSLSEEQLDAMVEKTKALEAYQEAGEDPKALECIPMLKRSDIKKEAAKIVNEELTVDNSLFLYHDVCTNGIGYVDLMFKTDSIAPEQIPYLGLLKSVLGYVDTEHYTYGELFNEINANTGGINCGVEVFDRADSTEEFQAMFSVRGKALYTKMDFLFKMIGEILNSSKLEDTKRLYEIVASVKSRAQVNLTGAGHSTAVLRAAAYSSPMAAFQDEMAGIGYYQFIEKLEKDFEQRKEETVEELCKLIKEILRPENFMISYTGERESLETVQKLAAAVKAGLGTEPVEKSKEKLTCTKKNEGFKTSGQVQYVAQTGNFKKKGLEYTGALEILKVILSYDYLWMNLRVKGGAYGCMSGFKRNGESYLVSYRDPHLKRTLDVYKGIPDYIRNFQADEREMTKYIIGTISGKDVPRTPQMKGSVSKTAYFCGVTEEMLQKERDQILNASAEDIHALAEIIEAVLAADQICVVGSESKVAEASDVLMEVKPLINC